MIKDQMNLELSVDTPALKSTIDASQLPDDDLTPYNVGFIPWEMVHQSTLFSWHTYHLEYVPGSPGYGRITPEDSLYTDDTKLSANKGVPFMYSITSSSVNFLRAVYKDPNTLEYSAAGDAYHAGSAMPSVFSKNLVYSIDLESIVSGNQAARGYCTATFFAFAILYDNEEFTYSQRSGIRSADISYNPVTDAIPDILFSFFLNGERVEFTLTNELFKEFTKLGGIYSVSTASHTYRIYCYCIGMHCYAQLGSNYISGFISDGFPYRYASTIGVHAFSNETSISGRVQFISCINSAVNSPIGIQLTTRAADAHTLANLDNLSEIEITLSNDNDIEENENYYLYSEFYAFNMLFKSFTATDLKIMALISTPLIKVDDIYYVPEFDESFALTGNWIEYDGRNLNPDDNTFDPADIPEPEPEGGEDWEGDRILPPVISGIGDLNGFISMYGLKPSQVAALGNYLWAKFTDTDFWQSISIVLDNTASIDPSVILNYVVSIRAYPFDLSDVSGTTSDLPLVYFGRGLVGIPVDSPTSLSMRTLHKCVDSFAGGQLDVPAYYGDFRDMEPCTKLLLHVPFCGSCEINPSQVVGKTLFLRYTIDFATGGMMAICYTSDSAGNMAYPVAELHGHVGASVQLTASNEIDALQSIAGIGSGVASLMMGNATGLLSGVVGAASSLASNRPVPHSTGRASGFSAYFQPRVPYIEIIYDRYYKPDNYAHTHGNACQVVKKIKDLHGYTVCKNVDTTGLTCDGDERIVIKRILESGFYAD